MPVSFRALLLLAKKGDDIAMAQIIEMYNPLIMKEAILNGSVDEDLRQELIATIVQCIRRIESF